MLKVNRLARALFYPWGFPTEKANPRILPALSDCLNAIKITLKKNR